MKLRLTILFCLCVVMVLPAQEEDQSLMIDFGFGLMFAYNSSTILMGEHQTENKLIYPFLALKVDVDWFEFLTVSLLAGYNQNHFNQPIEFSQLPLSILLHTKKNQSMMTGVHLYSEPIYFGDFTIKTRAQYLHFKRYKNEHEINLPVVSGGAESENHFSQLNADLLLQYDGLIGINLFLGPQINLLFGKIGLNENIEGIEAKEEISYRQKNLLGILIGSFFELGDHFEVQVEAGFFAKTSIAICAYYVF